MWTVHFGAKNTKPSWVKAKIAQKGRSLVPPHFSFGCLPANAWQELPHFDFSSFHIAYEDVEVTMSAIEALYIFDQYKYVRTTSLPKPLSLTWIQ